MNVFQVVPAALVLAVLLSSCGLFGPEKKPAGTEPVATEDWSQPATSEPQRQSDVDSCREQARAVLRQEQSISADIASRDNQGAFQNQAPELTQNMNEYEARQRYHRIFEDCMRGLGYVPAKD